MCFFFSLKYLFSHAVSYCLCGLRQIHPSPRFIRFHGCLETCHKKKNMSQKDEHATLYRKHNNGIEWKVGNSWPGCIIPLWDFISCNTAQISTTTSRTRLPQTGLSNSSDPEVLYQIRSLEAYQPRLKSNKEVHILVYASFPCIKALSPCFFLVYF